ncbi:hypothetical protein ACIP10_31140 [Streptomyces galbus]|uniref:hypothetical protein n=1 Tax=Streptomyces galbus TaxID=33898 RepID=UPI0038143B54
MAAFAALGPATSLLPAATGLLAAGAVGVAAAAGLPAAVRRITRRRVRAVDTGEAYAAVFFGLLAAEQRMHMLAERSGRYGLTRAAAMLPRLVWHAPGLVPLAADNVEARVLLLGYAQSLALLVDRGVEVERQEEAVESAIRDDRAAAVPVRPALPEGLLPRHLLEEARLELEELGEGLRHAWEVLGRAHDDGTQHVRSGESDE